MFCWQVKRKLYDFREGNLGESARKQISGHLGKCANCAREEQLLQKLLSVAGQRKAPELSHHFWDKFDQELAERLAREEAGQGVIKLRPQYSPRIILKPALALATLSIFLLAFSYYLLGGLPTRDRVNAFADERLVNDIETIEDLTGEVVLLDDTESFLNELDFLENPS